MKNSLTYARVALTAGAMLCVSIDTLLGAESNAPVVLTSSSPADTSTSVVKLPYGVEDVLKLSRANISEEIILNYVQSSGTIYNLGPQDIVYLRNQGVSDRVINAMVGQRKLVEATAQAQQQVTPAVPIVPTFPDASVAPVAPVYPDSGPAYAEPTAAPAASSVYVIPSPQVSAAYYGYYSYPYSYYGYYGPYYSAYCAPSVSIGIGFGGYGYYHGCYYGRGHYGYYGHPYGHGGHGWHR
jgi:hypothetical protein